MLKIFLVEDEFVVREGIKNIDWQSYGFEFCGEASDGELALPQIGKLNPDIVITDIKMPFMDGLELSRHIRKEYPDIEIVILSGYEEFGYAKEAISLGVARYLTKPIGSTELVEELIELRNVIEERRREKEISEQYQKDIMEETQNVRKNFFNDLVAGNKSVSEILEKADELKISLNASAYVIALGIISSKEHISTEYSHTILNAQNELQKFVDTDRMIYFDRGVEGFAIIFMDDSSELLSGRLKKYEIAFKETLDKYGNIRYYAGFGNIVSRISELNKSFTSAGKAFAHRYFENESNIVYASDRSSVTIADMNDVSISSINPKSFDRSRVIDFMKLGEDSEIDFFISELFENLGEEAMKSNMFRQYISMDIYFLASEFITDLGFDTNELEPVDIRLSQSDDVVSIQEYITKILKEVIKHRESVSHNKYKDIVDSVISYIEENYSDDELSLNTLAEHVRFSPNHLSMIFSQQMDMTLSKYLIEYRITKAKEALKCTALKSSEIAIECGYKDPHYFSYMFKKITGMTPTQYREGKND